MKKRNLFAEIAEGFEALADERAGKRTLRTHDVEVKPAPEVTAAELIALRERLLVPPTRIERVTLPLGGGCSIH
jgi:putative transcriptional regulator